jgi:DNA-binding response OmpR family regulator
VREAKFGASRAFRKGRAAAAISGSETDRRVTVRTVLIVEDEWAIADWLQVLLSENGYNVLSAGNGREALDILHRETPDLVLTDFMMPLVDGAGLLAAMQEKSATRDIPVVVVTSLLESVVRDRVVGYRAYLRKPFREAELMKIVRAILGR